MSKNLLNDDFGSRGGQSNRSRGQRPFGETENNSFRHREEHFVKYPKKHYPKIIETKLFISKEELVKYVNEKGQSDALIDIFKIEENLYKLVIKK